MVIPNISFNSNNIIR